MSQRPKATFNHEPAILSVPSQPALTGQTQMPGVGELPAIGNAGNVSGNPSGMAGGRPAAGMGPGTGLTSGKQGTTMGGSVAPLRGGHDGGFIGQSIAGSSRK